MQRTFCRVWKAETEWSSGGIVLPSSSSPIRLSCPFETVEEVWGEDKSICNITRVLPLARGMEETRENVTLCIRNRASEVALETELRASCVPGKRSATEPQLRHEYDS